MLPVAVTLAVLLAGVSNAQERAQERAQEHAQEHVQQRPALDSVAKATAAAGTLRVVPTGLLSDEGFVMVSLAAGEEAYDGDPEEGPFSLAIAIEGRRAEAVFTDLPHGEYALKLFHDENDNQKLDTNFMKIPKERFGFSNDAMGTFGPPSYAEARFTFDTAEMTLEIRMHGIRD